MRTLQHAFTTLVLLLLAIPLSAPMAAAHTLEPGASASDYPGQDSIQAIATSGRCEADEYGQVTKNVISPQISPKAEYCLHASGSCALSVHAEGTIKGDRIWLIFWERVTVNDEVKVETTLTCSGSYRTEVVHYGGAGLRSARADILEKNAGTNSDEGLGIVDPTRSATCEYHGPFGFCKTTLTGSWRTVNVFPGIVTSIKGDVSVCANFGSSNTLFMETDLEERLRDRGSSLESDGLQCGLIENASD